MSVVALEPVITAGGIAAARAAANGGFKVALTHMAIGDGNGAGYAPSRYQTALQRELVRVPIGGGEEIGDNAVSLQALIGPGTSFPIYELGFFAGSTLFAVWSESVELAARPSIASLVLALNLYLQAIPPNTITVQISGISLNILLAGPLAQIATETIRLQNRVIAQDNAAWIAGFAAFRP